MKTQTMRSTIITCAWTDAGSHDTMLSAGMLAYVWRTRDMVLKTF